MPQVVLHRSIMDDVRRGLGPVADRVELVSVDEKGAGADLAQAEACIRWDLDDDGLRTLLDEAPNLRWLHSAGAGVESFPLTELTSRNITVTNAAGIFAIPIAEWVLAIMLTAVKGTFAVRDAQQQRRWTTEVEPEELYDKSLLVLGTGGIGAEVITRAAGFGMRIWGSNRSGRSIAGAERVVSGDGWRELLPDADFVVSTLPLTSDTHAMFGAAELQALKSSAWLINVGRGATIDEDALIEALRAGALGGAALDAWVTEPLPTDHPAWDTPNMIVSPHMSGTSAAARPRGLELIIDNVRRFADGEPLTNQVDLSAGY
jgi:phosphoglycerate dehydrogenase-like enzyme